MRQLSITFLFTILLFLVCCNSVYSAIKGGVEYSLPVEYSHLSENELASKANKYFYLAQKYEDNILSDEMTDALMLYSVLCNVNPKNATYPIKLGILYDKLGKDRYAKGNFSHAIKLGTANFSGYYYFAEFYYKREMYRHAIKYYNLAFINSNGEDYNTLYKLGDIYEKFGDTKKSLEFLQKAYQISPNPNLQSKITRIKNFDAVNKAYYK